MSALPAVIVLCCAGAYLIALGAAALTTPALASRFLLGFATSARVHYLELLIRLVVGAALLLRAPAMPFSGGWLAIGWAIVASTACLFLLPWHWHRAFAQRAVPPVLRFIAPLGIVSALLGLALLAAAVSAPL